MTTSAAKKRPGKSPTDSPKPMPPMVAQPGGRGAIYQGGIPGNAGGGRPTSELRARLVGSFANRVNVIETIADGAPVQKIKVSLASLLGYVACPNCGDAFEANLKNGAPASLVEIEVLASASPGDRLKALDLAGKYGLGTKDEVTIVSPEITARLAQQVDVILRVCGKEKGTEVLTALSAEVWV